MEIAKPTGSMKIGPHGGLHHRAGLPSGQTITGNRRPGPLPKNRTPGGEAVEMIRSLCGRRRRQHLDDTDHLLPRNHRGSPSANSVSENKLTNFVATILYARAFVASYVSYFSRQEILTRLEKNFENKLI